MERKWEIEDASEHKRICCENQSKVKENKIRSLSYLPSGIANDTTKEQYSCSTALPVGQIGHVWLVVVNSVAPPAAASAS